MNENDSHNEMVKWAPIFPYSEQSHLKVKGTEVHYNFFF